MSIKSIDGGGVPPIKPIERTQPEPELNEREEKKPPEQPAAVDAINPELKDGKTRKLFLVKKKSGIYNSAGKAETEWKAFTEEEAKQAGLNWDEGRD